MGEGDIATCLRRDHRSLASREEGAQWAGCSHTPSSPCSPPRCRGSQGPLPQTEAVLRQHGSTDGQECAVVKTCSTASHRVASQVLLEQPPFPLLSAPAQLAALARLPISTARLLTRPPSRCISPPTHQTPRISPCTVLASVIIFASFYNQPFPASFCQLFET